jgi:hypothetical protein
VKILKRGRLFAVILSGALAAVVAASMPNAVADTFSSPQTGSHSVQGAILDKYRYFGGPAGVVGYPLSNELPTPGVFGRYNIFQYGAIYWSPPTGAHGIRGAIWQTWGALGFESSFLGFPTTDELPTPGRVGAYNAFSAGSIYWSPGTGAHSIGGAIRDQWARLGWENSRLGFPRTNEFPIPGGRAQDFECGSIQWSPARGTTVVGCAAPTPPPAPRLTVSQQNAQKSASDYLKYMSFSRSGLIHQLEFEGYSTGDATWAVDSLNVDWFQQAAKTAREYLQFGSFSRPGLINQLLFEGFTAQQAEFGVSQAGL